MFRYEKHESTVFLLIWWARYRNKSQGHGYYSNMLIDLILGRMEGERYNPKQFKKDVKDYCEFFDIYIPILNALLNSTDDNVKDELCKYIDEEWYGSPTIKNYIRSVSWK